MYAHVLEHGGVQKNAKIMYAHVLEHGGVQENARNMHAHVLESAKKCRDKGKGYNSRRKRALGMSSWARYLAMVRRATL